MSQFVKLALIGLCINIGGVYSQIEREILRWRTLTYADLPHEPTFKIGGQNYYIESNNIPIGVSVFRDRLFITVPRLDYGIPSTVNYVDLKQTRNDMSPSLHPYPDYPSNEMKQNEEGEIIGDPLQIVSVHRTRVDECGRLWFVDTGVIEQDGRVEKIIQPPAIWIFDLKTNHLVRRYEIPKPFDNGGHGYVSLNVDMENGRCDKVFAYIPNGVTNRILVYNFEEDRVWAFMDSSFLNTIENPILIGGQNYPVTKSIVSIALGKKNRKGIRNAYYQPFGSNYEFTVSTDVLKNEAKSLISSNPDDFKNIGNRGNSSQTIIHDFDPRTGVIYFSHLTNNSITCWDTRQQLTPDNIGTVVKDDGLLIYISDIKAEITGNLWYLSNRRNLIERGAINRNYYNFYIFKMSTRSNVRNTVCDPLIPVRNILSTQNVENKTNVDDLADRDGMLATEWVDEGLIINLPDDLEVRDGMVSHDFDKEAIAQDHRFVDGEHILVTIDKNNENEDQRHGYIHSRQRSESPVNRIRFED